MALKNTGEIIDYKKIRKSFFDHKSKTFEATMADFMIAAEKELTGDEKRVEIESILAEIDKGKDEYNNLKNKGLYVSFENNVFVQPSSCISEEEARSSLEKAKLRYKQAYLMSEREVDFDLKYGTHPRMLTDL